MKRALGLAFGLCLSFASAAPVIPLPSVIIEVDGRKISSSKIQKAWEKGVSALPDDIPFETIQRLYKKLVDEVLWQNEISLMLAEAGIRPDRETAEKYLNHLLKDVPPERSQALKLANLHAQDAPEMRLKAALHFYLKQKDPAAITVTSYELENYYRNNQMRFKQSGKVILGVLELKDRKQAEMAWAALQQGASFEAAAKLYAPQSRSRITREMLELARSMKPGEIAPLRKKGEFWQIIQLRKRTPERFLSLKEAAPLIRLELSARKEAAALSLLLRKRLEKKKIVYTPLLQQQTNGQSSGK